MENNREIIIIFKGPNCPQSFGAGKAENPIVCSGTGHLCMKIIDNSGDVKVKCTSKEGEEYPIEWHIDAPYGYPNASACTYLDWGKPAQKKCSELCSQFSQLNATLNRIIWFRRSRA